MVMDGFVSSQGGFNIIVGHFECKRGFRFRGLVCTNWDFETGSRVPSLAKRGMARYNIHIELDRIKFTK